jgi:fatty acid desaturase
MSIHAGLITVLGVCGALVDGVWYWPAAFVQGVLMVFLFCPLHETTHRTAFRSRLLNRIVGDAVGFLLILPPRWFGAFHMAHHRFTQDPERDPELATPKPTTLPRYIVIVSGAVYWRFAILGLLQRALGRADGAFLDARSRRRSIVEARVYVLLYAGIAAASVATGSTLVVWSWIVPVMLGQPLLRLYLLAEHWGCPNVRSMWENTRTMRTLAPVRWLTWNMPYHAEHHANPGVPFHNLPAFAHSALATPHVVQDGYARFHAERLEALADGRAGRM